MADKTQNFANHARFMPMFHFFAAPLSMIFLIWSAWRAMTIRDVETHYLLVGALALFGAVSISRLSPVRAQDRLIRLEEQLRYARLLPADLAARGAIHNLCPRRGIAPPPRKLRLKGKGLPHAAHLRTRICKCHCSSFTQRKSTKACGSRL